MAEAFIEFNNYIFSDKITLTKEEINLINSWKQSALRNIYVSAASASVAAWLATRRLHKLHRTTISVGAGWLCGKWRLHSSVDSGLELILSQHGTRLQKELGEIMLKKYQHNPLVLRRLSKYFYSEDVFDGDSTDQPEPRWRFRGTYGEIFSSDRIEDDESSSKKTDSGDTDRRKPIHERKDINMNASSKDLQMNGATAPSLESTEDPFDCILGRQVSVEETHHPDAPNTRPNAPNTRPRRRSHSDKRSLRRRRMHHQENLDS